MADEEAGGKNSILPSAVTRQGNTWTVEFARKLRTGEKTDVEIAPGKKMHLLEGFAFLTKRRAGAWHEDVRISLSIGARVRPGRGERVHRGSRRWGERRGQMATMILRNALGIPLWIFGYILAWRALAPFLFTPVGALRTLGWLLVAVGAVPVIWGHLRLGLRTHMPSVRYTLVRTGLYARLRHPIYAGGILIFVGLALLRPTAPVLIASALGIGWAVLQARLEELDLVQRLPDYREYMRQVPRFFPRLG